MKSDDSPFKVNEYTEYESKLTAEEKKFIRKFYREWYMTDFYREEENIIKDKKVKSEAIRNKYALNNDAINKGAKAGLLSNLSDTDKAFMEDASDAWEEEFSLEEAFQEEGYEFCVDHLMEETIEMIGNKYLDLKLTLAKFYIKMNKLRIIRGRRKKK